METPQLVAEDKLYGMLVDEVAAADLPAPPFDESIVSDNEVEALPDVVQRYLRFMRVVGRPRDHSFCVRFAGRFRLRKGLGWMPAEAWQYNTSPDVARIYVMRLRFARVIPMIGRDTYHHGHGQMVGKLLDRWTVADGHGEAFDVSELVTYLNDAVLLAPSMLTPATVWTGVDASTFDVTLTDAGRHVTGQVYLDEQGIPVDFATNDRYIDLPGGPVQAEWHTPIDGWTTGGDRPLPEDITAVWHLPSGPFAYASGRFVPESLGINGVPSSRWRSEELRLHLSGDRDDQHRAVDNARHPPAHTLPE